MNYEFETASASRAISSIVSLSPRIFSSSPAAFIQAEASARSNVKENLVAAAIADEVGIKLTDKEYEEDFRALSLELGFDSVEAMKEEAPSEDYLRNMVLRTRVMEWLVDHCEQVENAE